MFENVTVMPKKKKECYMCDELSTTREHVPATSFFPEEYRLNLITVPSCDQHNTATSLDDEYVRNIIVMCDKNNDNALQHWKSTVIRSFTNSPKLIEKTFSTKKEAIEGENLVTSFLMDRSRINKVLIKIGYGLHYKEFKSRWSRNIIPLTNHLFFEDLQTDELSKVIPDYADRFPNSNFNGANPSIFKYRFDEAIINGVDDKILRMIFYDGFTVWVVPNIPKP